jgi:hypothetical protein
MYPNKHRPFSTGIEIAEEKKDTLHAAIQKKFLF